MSPKDNRIGVVYLMWLPFGIDYFNSFISSYVKHPSGLDHELYILFNGVDDLTMLDDYLKILQEYKIDSNILTIQSGQDIDAYVYAAKQIDVDAVLFLNTYSILLAADWLKKYYNAFIDPKIGAVSATGSWQSHYSLVFIKHKWKPEWEKGFQYNFRKYKLFIKAFFYWRLLFKPFPSPHIRTNGFMVNRTMFLDLSPKRLKNKFQAYLFENSRKGFTNQLLKKGYKVIVIDKNGKTYLPEEWKDSKTFWSGNQENLLISDNQTRIYENATADERKKLSFLVWGQ